MKLRTTDKKGSVRHDCLAGLCAVSLDGLPIVRPLDPAIPREDLIVENDS